MADSSAQARNPARTVGTRDHKSAGHVRLLQSENWGKRPACYTRDVGGLAGVDGRAVVEFSNPEDTPNPGDEVPGR